MKSGQKIDLGLTGYDELFMTDQERAENKLPRIFNMLILVGAVKMADRVVKEMMGL